MPVDQEPGKHLSVDWLDTILPSLTGTSRDQVAAMYPASRDAKAAVRWMRAHAHELQIHPDYVTALGGSAGSFLAVMLGVTDEADFTDELLATEDPTLEGTWPEQSAAVQTIIDHWGAGSIAELAGFIDGQSRFDASDAPISIVHGTEDPTVLFEEAEELEATWVKTGVPYVFHPLEGAGHGPWGASVDGKDLSMLAMDFIVEQQGLTVVP